MRYFVAVAENLNFGRAADVLMTAQPSLSRQILQLEDELGVKLFERNKRHVAVTDAGKQFLIDAKHTLQAADASMRHARENADGTRGELRIGFIGAAMLMKLPAILHEYRRRFPDVDVIPHAMPYPEHYPALHSATIDIAWTIALPDADIATAVISSNGLTAVMPADHRLAKRRKIDLADFSGETLIVLAKAAAPILYDETMRLCIENGYQPPHVHEVLEEQTVLGMVAAGFGVAVVPIPWTGIHVPGIEVRKLAVTWSIDTALSWHRERTTPIVRAFVKTALSFDR